MSKTPTFAMWSERGVLTVRLPSGDAAARATRAICEAWGWTYHGPMPYAQLEKHSATDRRRARRLLIGAGIKEETT